MKSIKNVFSFFVTLGLIVGLKFYDKSSDHDDLKNAMLESCDADQACISSINTHFDGCFDSSYHMQRRGSDFDAQAFEGCMQSKIAQK